MLNVPHKRALLALSSYVAATMLAGCGGATSSTQPLLASHSVAPAEREGVSLKGETFSSTAGGSKNCHTFMSYLHTTWTEFKARGTASGPFPGTFTSGGSASVTSRRGSTTYQFQERFEITFGSQKIVGIVKSSLPYSLTCPNKHGDVEITGFSFKVRHGTRGATSAEIKNHSLEQSFY
jgi:hypothetical protein